MSVLFVHLFVLSMSTRRDEKRTPSEIEAKFSPKSLEAKDMHPATHA
tara:strand:- start:333 stop:473 length:141 start_codon:yes stop_codon:yes gene_type:complete